MNLITGATGLLGSYLAKHLLKKGERVRSIKRKTSNTSLLGDYVKQIEWVDGDVLDITSLDEAMHGVTHIYHCAAVISFVPSETDYMIKVNVEGTANVMNAALTAGVQKVVHVGSIAGFGLPVNGRMIDEKFFAPNINKSPRYYQSKHYGEREVWRAHEEGLNVTIVCPSTIIGAGWWDTEPNSLFREIYNGLKFYTSATNGFIDVRDAADCAYRLMKSDINGEKFILSSENLSFRDVTWQMADELKVRRPEIEVGKGLLSMTWKIERIKSLVTRKRPLVTKESAEIASVSFAYSNEKIKKALSYNFKPIKETIAETAVVFLKSKKEGKEFGVFE